MRLFIYELISAGGLGPDVPPSLRQEGAAMLNALVEDFQRVAGVHVLTLLADDCAPAIGHDCRRIAPADEPHAFRERAVAADAALIIAPEFDGLLERRTGWAVAAGCQILGCSQDAIRLTRDKFKLARWLEDGHVATPPTCCVSSVSPAPSAFPCVLKPRDGAGSQATFMVRSESDWPTCLEMAQREWPAGDFIVQPFHPGQPVSVALLVGREQIVTTPGATQRLSDDGRFRYLGGRTPLPLQLRDRAVSMALCAVESVPGLLGYVGVDLILGDAADGSQDVDIEINPRLTTSYIGLRRLTRANLAKVWLQLWNGAEVDEPTWSDETIDFVADGATWLAV